MTTSELIEADGLEVSTSLKGLVDEEGLVARTGDRPTATSVRVDDAEERP